MSASIRSFFSRTSKKDNTNSNSKSKSIFSFMGSKKSRIIDESDYSEILNELANYGFQPYESTFILNKILRLHQNFRGKNVHSVLSLKLLELNNLKKIFEKLRSFNFFKLSCLKKLLRYIFNNKVDTQIVALLFHLKTFIEAIDLTSPKRDVILINLIDHKNLSELNLIIKHNNFIVENFKNGLIKKYSRNEDIINKMFSYLITKRSSSEFDTIEESHESRQSSKSPKSPKFNEIDEIDKILAQPLSTRSRKYSVVGGKKKKSKKELKPKKKSKVKK